LGRYRLGVVPIKNAAGTEPDNYWKNKKASLAKPTHQPKKVCAICGEGRIKGVAQLKWKSTYKKWTHNHCLEAYLNNR
jgi:hypothetical protein